MIRQMKKSEVRKEVFRKRREISDEEADRRSRKVFGLVREYISDLEKEEIFVTEIFAYASYNHETDTRAFIRECLEKKIRVALPRVGKDGCSMEFCYIESMEDVESGYRGIPEPSDRCRRAEEVSDSENRVILVPGVGFDKTGNRVGYGKGFYDRYLAGHSFRKKIGIAFGFQIFEEVESGADDIRMDVVVTEKEIYGKRERNRMELLEQMGKKAGIAKQEMIKLNTNDKNRALQAAASALVEASAEIIRANHEDVENGRKNGMKESIIDRLVLTEERIKGMAEGILNVASLEDPVGEVTGMSKRPNGMVIGKRRVPLGVIGIIYEARPNVTSDAFALCFKSGNVAILKGGSDAIHSNLVIVKVLRKALEESGINPDCVQLIASTDRAVTTEFMKMNQYIDLLIPRGSAGLIRATLENSTIPVIETGTGNCHVYVDDSADFDMAVQIIVNAKTQRIGVCNACESLVVHRDILPEFLPVVVKALKEKGVEIRGDEECLKVCPELKRATEEDFYTEYLDYIISVKTVGSIDEAVAHINEHNTKHSECIVTKDYNHANQFLDEVDAACVYVNASTRFTDGNEFGFGAEIGISTQKLHARGPMGLRELTTYKYIIYGDGQIR